MSKLNKRSGFILLLVIMLLLLCAAGARIIYNGNSEKNINASAASSTEIFTFTTLNNDECDVRLSDKSVTQAIIPESVTIGEKEYKVVSIAANGFSSATNLEKVRLPHSIKSIGQNAFLNCKTLNSITLPAVETIGANAFGMTNMEYLIIPKTVTSVGATILRSASTKVYVRSGLKNGETVPTGWATNWNANNNIQDVEYNSQYVPELKYTYVENANPIGNYSLTRTNLEGGYYVDSYQEFVTFDDGVNVEVYIPAVYKDGRPIVGISQFAFYDNNISKLTIGYAEEAINLDSYAFYGLKEAKVTINRDVTLLTPGWNGEYKTSENVFLDSTASIIILPNTIKQLGNYMFANCAELEGIEFVNPNKNLTQEEEMALGEISPTKAVYLPAKADFTTIGDEAFSGVRKILYLHIPQNVVNVGEKILINWNNTDRQQVVHVDYDNVEALPAYNAADKTGWNPQWAEACEEDVIEFNNETTYNIFYIMPTGTNNDNNPTFFTRKDEVNLQAASRLGYVFEGWYDNQNYLGEKIEKISKGTVHNVYLYAKFSPITYTVVYEANKPSRASKDVVMTTSSSFHTYDEPKVLTTNGYALEGWHFVNWIDENGVTYINNQSVLNLTTQNGAVIVMKAQWEPNQYTITFESNAPQGSTSAVKNSMPVQVCEFDKKISLSQNEFFLKGWSFMGWSRTPGGEVYFADGATIENLSSIDQYNISLYAQWKANPYSVTYDKNTPTNASHEVTGSMPQTAHTYDTPSKLRPNTFELTGWIFTGWDTKADGTGTSYTNGASVSTVTSGGTITLYAQWEPISYTVEYDTNKPANASNTVRGSMKPTSHTYDKPSELRPNTFELTGWTFTGWNTKANGTGTSYANGASVSTLTATQGETITLYAQWKANVYYIEYDSNKPVNSTNITGYVARTTHYFDSNTGDLIPSIKLISWDFLGWTYNSKTYQGGTYPGNLTPLNGVTLRFTAQWKEKSLEQCQNSSGVYEIATVNQLKALSNYGSKGLSFKLIGSINVSGNWTAIQEFNGTLDGNGYTITYGHNSIASSGVDYGFFIQNNGTIKNLNVKATLRGIENSDGSKIHYVGAIAAKNYGTISKCQSLSGVGVGNDYYDSKTNHKVDAYFAYGFTDIGGIAAINYGTVENCNNYMSIGGYAYIAGIVVDNSSGSKISNCANYGNIYFDQMHKITTNTGIGGIVMNTREESKVLGCANHGDILFAAFSILYGTQTYVHMAQIVANACTTATISGYSLEGSVKVNSAFAISSGNIINSNEPVAYYYEPVESGGGGSCIASGTLITLADGSQRAVELLTGEELLLVWNLSTGTYDVAPIIFIDSEEMALYEVINLYFSDGTSVKVISEHGFWDFNLNQYVFLRDDAAKYIGHWFNKEDLSAGGNNSWKKVQLVDVIITQEYTQAWSPVTYGHLCYYVNGMLSMPGATEGLINIFDVDSETMQYDQEALLHDMDLYGTFTYEEFASIYPVPVDIFNAFNGQYLKVSIGKGLIDYKSLGELIERYCKFF